MRSWARITFGGLVLSTLAGVFLGVCAATANEAEATSYLSNDPRACVNCHIMREQYDGWQHSGHHAAATCNDCHVPQDFFGKYLTKMEHGYRHSKAFTLQDFHEPIRITQSSLDVVEDNCLRCHGEFVGDIAGHAGATPGSARLACVHCHSRVGHDTRK